jgi:hypothetical protein
MATTCANPKCNLALKGTNPKKRFCNLRCKNKAAYLYRLDKYDWEEKMQKKRRKNIQLLEYSYSLGFTKITINELEKMGFNEDAAHIPFTDDRGRMTFRFGNLLLVALTPTECKIELIKPKKDDKP